MMTLAMKLHPAGMLQAVLQICLEWKQRAFQA